MMTSNRFPLVSVIIPVYNHENYVTHALQSVLYQTYPNLEIIIIDDGSTDSSCFKIETTLATWNQTITNNRKIQFLKQENRGPSNTINTGLSLATGEWLTILNSDDFYHIERIQTLLQQTLAAKAEIAFSYVIGVDDQNQTLPPEHPWWRWYDDARNQLLSIPTVGFQLLKDNLSVTTGNLFFSRSLYEKIGSFKNLKITYGLDFIVRALIQNEPLMVRENHYFYRLHDKNTEYPMHHLIEIERNEVYRDYLSQIFDKPPKNRQAPCHWYWPLEFSRWRLKLKMDRGLESYILWKKTSSHATQTQLPLTPKNKKGPSVTLFSHELSLSGAPKLVTDVALCLHHHGYTPHIISLADGPMRKTLENHGFTVHILQMNNISKIKKLWTFLYTICFLVKGKVIVNSMVSWQIILAISLMRPRTKPVWYIHEAINPFGVLTGIRGKIYSSLITLSKKLTPPRLWFGSNSTRKAWAYSQYPHGKVMYWSGIPRQIINCFPKSTLKHLLSIGTASSRKGTHSLVDAFLICLQENRIPKDATLTIVGFPNHQSPDFLSLGDTILKIVNSEFRNNIKMIGSVQPNDLHDFYINADIFIQASVSECMPIALLTAMSRGLPIITTNVDGCAEATEDRQTAYHCLPYDIDSLVKAITEAINNPQQSIELGKKANKIFNERFSLEATQGPLINDLFYN